MNWFLKMFALISCAVLTACGASTPPPAAPPVQLNFEGKTYEGTQGKTVVEPNGPWYGMSDVCPILDAWKFGFMDAKNSGYNASLADGQLFQQIQHATGQMVRETFCKEVAKTSIALRYSTSFLQVMMENSLPNGRVPTNAFTAWQQAENACIDRLNDKKCLEKHFRTFYYHVEE